MNHPQRPPRFTEGPARAFIPQVPRMWPQQIPWFSYREVPITETGKRIQPIIDLTAGNQREGKE